MERYENLTPIYYAFIKKILKKENIDWRLFCEGVYNRWVRHSNKTDIHESLKDFYSLLNAFPSELFMLAIGWSYMAEGVEYWHRIHHKFIKQYNKQFNSSK